MKKTNKTVLLRKYISSIEKDIMKLKQLLDEESATLDAVNLDSILTNEENTEDEDGGGRVIHGVFDGQQMVCEGENYSVPANYASKSKLVEGDSLKLTIKDDGSFVYKQTQPVVRKRLVGVLAKDSKNDTFKVLVEKNVYSVLLASVTYFRGEVGDEVVLLVPESSISQWAAVENIIKAGEAPFDDSLLAPC